MPVTLHSDTAVTDAAGNPLALPDNFSPFRRHTAMRATKMSDTFLVTAKHGHQRGVGGDYLAVDTDGWLMVIPRADFEANWQRIGGPHTPDVAHDVAEAIEERLPADTVVGEEERAVIAEAVAEVERERDDLAAQIDDLGTFIIRLDVGYPKEGGACYNAKALIADLLEKQAEGEGDTDAPSPAMAALIAAIIEYGEEPGDSPIATAARLLTPEPVDPDDAPDFVVVYGRDDGNFDWRRHDAHNHNIVSTSGGQGYEDQGEAVRMAKKVNPGCVVEVDDGTEEPVEEEPTEAIEPVEEEVEEPRAEEEAIDPGA